ncbi:MAG: sodium:alanine symporter family protein [Arsenophonus sp.]|nr:MAG: sodium:alanine symporter family protein [Arsenophonus sp.]
MTEIVDNLNNIFWGKILIYLLIGVGLYFTFGTKFIQFRHFRHMFSLLRESNKSNSYGISSFQALCTTLAARVGTGNLTGIAIALTAGGPGAIFWMWIIAVIGMATSFIENTLAQLYKIKDIDGNYRGGPAYYIKNGLDMPWLGVLFSIFLILSFGLIFNAVQSNSIAQAASFAFKFKPHYIGIILSVTCGIIIFGGFKFIARIAEFVVPIMAISYLTLAIWIMITHIAQLKDIFLLIIKEAFGYQKAIGGIMGYTVYQSMIQGIQRGLFSNEAGMGSSPNAAAAATPYPPHPASQGYIQMLGVFVDTIVICSATAIIIILSGALDTNQSISGIELTQKALSLVIGEWGKYFIAIAIFFFAFTSIIANYAYAESNMIFLEKNYKIKLYILRIGTLIMIIFGSITEMPFVWKLADLSMGFMTLINLIAILMLSNVAFKVTQDYNEQKEMGKLPKFKTSNYFKIKNDVWK